ncbi:MAG TPA: hypothetical protein VFR39_04700, partial [Burkholderiales bacterium]|nr:hypothetical protein [Burkholderiales bacterium]
NATLDGALDVALINGFVPASGNSFTVVQGGTVTGVFASTPSSMTTTYLASSVNLATNAPPPQLPPSAPAPPLIEQLPGVPESGSGTGLNIVTVVNPETGEREILDGIVGQNIVTTVNPQTGEREIVDITAGDSKSGGKIGVCK